jgi:hypothetical protein
VTLPAHRFEHRKKRDPSDLGPPYIWCFDVDDTITAAPVQYARLSEALKAIGDKVVVVTGHGPKRTREQLLDAVGFAYDEIIIVDPGELGEGKAKVLKRLGAFFMFDDRIEFGPEILRVCPVAFQYEEPPGDSKPKKDAEAAAKALKKT